MAAEVRQAREALQSASAAHAKEVARLLQQVKEASEVRRAQNEEAATPVPAVCGHGVCMMRRHCSRVVGSGM